MLYPPSCPLFLQYIFAPPPPTSYPLHAIRLAAILVLMKNDALRPLLVT